MQGVRPGDICDTFDFLFKPEMASVIEWGDRGLLAHSGYYQSAPFVQDQQCITDEQVVRILGIAGTRYERVAPEEIGIKLDAYAVGNRSPMSKSAVAQLLTAFMQQAANVEQVRIAQAQAQVTIPGYKPSIDFAALSSRLLRSLGLSGIESIFTGVIEDDPPMEPNIEHLVMLDGQRVLPRKTENIQEHLKAHMLLKSSAEFASWPEEAQDLLDEHIVLTVRLASEYGGNLSQQPQQQQGNGDIMGVNNGSNNLKRRSVFPGRWGESGMPMSGGRRRWVMATPAMVQLS